MPKAITSETNVGTIFVQQSENGGDGREHRNQFAAETPATSVERRPGIGHNRPPPEEVLPLPPPYYVTYAELRALGIPYSRKHLLDMMRGGRFPQARQLSTNRVGWVHAEILEHLATRPVARAALLRTPKAAAEPDHGVTERAERLR